MLVRRITCPMWWKMDPIPDGMGGYSRNFALVQSLGCWCAHMKRCVMAVPYKCEPKLDMPLLPPLLATHDPGQHDDHQSVGVTCVEPLQ